MANTEIYIIRKNRRIDDEFISIPGAWQGAWRIWSRLEKKYLPSLPPPRYDRHSEEYQSRLHRFWNRELMKEIWAIPRMKKTEWNDRIIMEIYMDRAYIAYNDLHEVAEALRNSEFASDNMKAQADALDKIHDENTDGSIMGVMINPTSVNCAQDFMECLETDEEGNGIAYGLKEDYYDALQYLRDLRRLDYDFERYVEYVNNQDKERPHKGE